MRVSRESGVCISYLQNNKWLYGYTDRMNMFDSYMGFLVMWKRDTLMKTFVNPATIDEFSLYELSDNERKIWESICDGEEG